MREDFFISSEANIHMQRFLSFLQRLIDENEFLFSLCFSSMSSFTKALNSLVFRQTVSLHHLLILFPFFLHNIFRLDLLETNQGRESIFSLTRRLPREEVEEKEDSLISLSEAAAVVCSGFRLSLPSLSLLLLALSFTVRDSFSREELCCLSLFLLLLLARGEDQ